MYYIIQVDRNQQQVKLITYCLFKMTEIRNKIIINLRQREGKG